MFNAIIQSGLSFVQSDQSDFQSDIQSDFQSDFGCLIEVVELQRLLNIVIILYYLRSFFKY